MSEFFSALAGAFFGALAAYLFQCRAEALKLKDDNHKAVIRAQLALITQANTLLAIEHQYLDRFRTDADRHRNIGGFWMADADPVVPADSLSFLLLAGRANLVHDFHIAQRSYLTAVDAVRIRNEAHSALIARSRDQSVDPQTGRMAAMVPHLEDFQLREATDALYTSVDSAHQQCRDMIMRLKDAGKVVFPKKEFLNMAEKEAPQRHA